jgi:hypothetical protein
MRGDDGRELGFLIHQMVANPQKDPKAYPIMLSMRNGCAKKLERAADTSCRTTWQKWMA